MHKSLVDIPVEEFIELVSNSSNINELGIKLGFSDRPGKSSREKIKKRMDLLELDFSNIETKEENPEKIKIEKKPEKIKIEIGHNMKDIGNIGEAYFQYECLKNDIPISKVIGENRPYEFVVEFGKNNFKKIQVKTSSVFENGKSIFYLRKTNIKKQKYSMESYSEGDLDYYYLYSLVLECGYLVEFKNAGDSITIRKDIKYNGYNDGQNSVKKHDEYLFKNVLLKILE